MDEAKTYADKMAHFMDCYRAQRDAYAAMQSLYPMAEVDVNERVYVELESRTFYSWGDESEVPVNDFVSGLNALSARAPRGSDVVIRFSSESDYDGPSNPSYEVGYWRDPTPEEKAEREEHNREAREHNARLEERRAEQERAEFERLKAKYER
jgi:hypothetical protein